MNRRGEHVVGALAHVDVVIGVDRLVGGEAVAPIEFNRPIGNHLVDVHVAGSARPGLEDVDGELVIELSIDDLLARRQQGIHLGVVQGILAALGELAEVAVGDRRRPLDAAQGVDQFGWQSPAADRKVVDGPLCLGAIVSLGGDLDVAHGVVFGAKIAHRGQSDRWGENETVSDNRRSGWSGNRC